MIAEIKDTKTGIVKHEIKLAEPDIVRDAIESLGGVLQTMTCGDTAGYVIDYSGEEVRIISSDSKMILTSESEYVLFEIEHMLGIEYFT